jgi:plastocyanin
MGFLGIVRLLISIGMLAVLLSPYHAVAQDDTGATIVAGDLVSPRGFLWAGSETILVASAGTGGGDGAVFSIANASCPAPLSSGLPSTIDAAGHVSGPGDLAVLDGQLYVAIGGSLSDGQGGISIVFGDGSTLQIADLSSWARPELAGALPVHLAPIAGYSMISDPDGGVLWVSDPANQQVLTVTADGTVNRIADLAPLGLVPTRMALSPDGGVYAGALDGSSTDAGTARVVRITAAGDISDAWTDLTAVSDVAVGPEGDLYALEMSADGAVQDPASGRLVRQDGSGEEAVITDGLSLPVAMAIGPDDAFYIASSTDGNGEIMRVAPDGSPATFAVAPECAPLEGATGTVDGGNATESPAPTPGPPTAGSQAPVMSEVQVGMIEITFQPAVIEVPAGTTIRWTNMDDVEHTATGITWEFDTGVIAPGDSATVMLDVPGTYVYFCQFYPGMQATIVVV